MESQERYNKAENNLRISNDKTNNCIIRTMDNARDMDAKVIEALPRMGPVIGKELRHDKQETDQKMFRLMNETVNYDELGDEVSKANRLEKDSKIIAGIMQRSSNMSAFVRLFNVMTKEEGEEFRKSRDKVDASLLDLDNLIKENNSARAEYIQAKSEIDLENQAEASANNSGSQNATISTDTAGTINPGVSGSSAASGVPAPAASGGVSGSTGGTTGSLIDDFANPSSEMPSYIEPED